MDRRKMWLAGLLAAAGLFLGSQMTVRAQESVPFGFVQMPQGVMWKNADGTWAQDEWVQILGLIYHVDQNGYIQTGMTKVGDATYYLLPEGRLYTGWLTLGEDLYYFREDGTMAADTAIGAWLLGKDGRLIPQAGQPLPTEVSPLQMLVSQILSEIVTPEMTQEQKLRACYDYMMARCSYKRSYEKPSGDWTGTYATDILTTGKGNCYRFASGFAYLAKGLGYESRVATGQIKSKKGGVTPHGWTEIKLGDAWYLFDADMQDSNGRDYYMKTYEAYPTKPLIKEAEWAVQF